MKLTIEDLGYVEEMRERLGLEPDDTSSDDEIVSMSPLKRVELLAGWHLGDPSWTETFKYWCESQGIYWTTNPDADGVIE
jgi:hypothetical protein